MASNKRVNISIPEEAHSLLESYADKYYEGNFSRFLIDAGMFFAGVLSEKETKSQK
jgi:hypothetical protein